MTTEPPIKPPRTLEAWKLRPEVRTIIRDAFLDGDDEHAINRLLTELHEIPPDSRAADITAARASMHFAPSDDLCDRTVCRERRGHIHTVIAELDRRDAVALAATIRVTTVSRDVAHELVTGILFEAGVRWNTPIEPTEALIDALIAAVRLFPDRSGIKPATNCYCCSCGSQNDDPYCRNHGHAGMRPCETHGFAGSPDEGSGIMPLSVQTVIRDRTRSLSVQTVIRERAQRFADEIRRENENRDTPWPRTSTGGRGPAGPDERCRGSCSRGGDGPSCGLPGCRG